VAIIRGRRWKYVHFAALPPLLFDIENDPDEMNDLSKDPAHAPMTWHVVSTRKMQHCIFYSEHRLSLPLREAQIAARDDAIVMGVRKVEERLVARAVPRHGILVFGK